MGVLVRRRTDRPKNWWIIIAHKGFRKKISFLDKESAEETAVIIREQIKNQVFETGRWGPLATVFEAVPFFDPKDGENGSACVYFMQIESDGPIKIGHTKGNNILDKSKN